MLNILNKTEKNKIMIKQNKKLNCTHMVKTSKGLRRWCEVIFPIKISCLSSKSRSAQRVIADGTQGMRRGE